MDRCTRRVLEHLARGLTSAEIAERLDSTPERIREIINAEMQRRGARSRLALVLGLLGSGELRL